MTGSCFLTQGRLELTTESFSLEVQQLSNLMAFENASDLGIFASIASLFHSEVLQ